MMTSLTVTFLLLAVGASYVAPAQYVNEVYFVIEPQVVRNYMAKGFNYTRAEAIDQIKGDFVLLLHEMNEFYKTIQYYVDIELRVKKLEILTEEVFEECKRFKKNKLFTDFSLEIFKEWLEAKDAQNRIGYDMAIVLTGFDLYNGDQGSGNAGLATVSATCRKDVNVAIAEFNGLENTAMTAAHEIAHSLGSPHDPARCSGGYLMSPTNSPSNKNNFKFSSCTGNSIRQYIHTLDQGNNNCLLRTTAHRIGFSWTQERGRDIMSEQKICERHLKTGDVHVCTSSNLYGGGLAKGDALCKAIFCGRKGSNQCSAVIPTDGMICDSGKRCALGRCSPAPGNFPVPSNVDGNCLHGDTGNFIVNGVARSCASMVKTEGGSLCYNARNRQTCCDTCKKIKTNDAGCEYGDAGHLIMNGRKLTCADAVKVDPGVCYGNKHLCCASCKKAKTNIPGCEYGDTGHFRINQVIYSCADRVKIDPGLCYRNKKACCASCEKAKKNNPGCEYGNQIRGCDSYDKKSLCGRFKKRELCCETCSDYNDDDNGFDFGKRSVLPESFIEREDDAIIIDSVVGVDPASKDLETIPEFEEEITEEEVPYVTA